MGLLASNAIRGPTPHLASSYFSVVDTPHAGRGAFATTAVPASTDIFTCHAPCVNVIYKQFRKEVCGHCFSYDRGRKMKVAYMAGNGKDFRGLAWFCSDVCKEKWTARLGDDGIEALLCIFTALSKHKKAKTTGDDTKSGKDSTTNVIEEREIEQAWGRAASLPTAKDAHLLEEDNEDTLLFLLDGIIARHKRPQDWEILLALNPTLLPYLANPCLLPSHIRMYQFLRLHLSEPFLSHCTPETILALITREFGNSFGIWEDDVGDDVEMLGYGAWVEASFFNHSCGNNLKKRIEGRVFHFYMTRDVQEGEQLCINYIGEAADAPLEERRRQLQKGWGFCCECSKCTRQQLEEKAKDGPSG